MNYKGYHYRTLTGLQKDVSSGLCEEVWAAMPAGYSMVNAAANTDVVNNVVKNHPWSTAFMIFTDGMYGTKGRAEKLGGTWFQKSDDHYKSRSCAQAILIRMQCGAVPPPVPWCPAETAATVNYDGYEYRTLTGFQKDLKGNQCENSWTAMPDGYSMVPLLADVVSNVVKNHPWNTALMVFPKGIRGTDNNVKDRKVDGSYWQQIGNQYRVTGCAEAILIRKKCPR